MYRILTILPETDFTFMNSFLLRMRTVTVRGLLELEDIYRTVRVRGQLEGR